MAGAGLLESATETTVRLLDPIEDPRWMQFVGDASEALIFHHPRWLALLREQYGYRIMACCITGGNRQIRAGLPLALVSSSLTGRRLVALPFSDCCPPLSTNGLGGAIADALDELRASLRIKLRVHGPLVGAVARPGPAYHQHLVALGDDIEAVQERFTSSQALRGVRRAEREGVVIEHRTDVEALAAFYRLHAANRRRQGLPTQPRSFILGLSALFEHGLGFVSLASAEGTSIAAAVFLVFNGVLTYKYGASDPRSLNKRPNNLIFMDAIRWGCEEGLATLDLGRTDLGHESLRAFKLMWGAQERILQYSDLCEPGAEWSAQRSPAALSFLIRRTPTRVSRSLGELLYRHVG